MAASVFDTAHLSRLFDAGDAARLFTDSAEIRALMLVEGTLAKVQGEAGVIPEISGRAIHRASLELQIDPAGLAGATGRNGVSIPALVEAFRELMQAPEHAQYLHWGATSQDIIDTGLMLRLRQAVALIRADTAALLSALASLAEDHADTAMVGRTYGQHGAPTSFGALVTSWGWPLAQADDALAALEFPVSLSGAVGTGSALGPDPAGLRAALAGALALSDPGRGWHADRAPVGRIADACATLLSAAAKLGGDVELLASSDIAEIALEEAGGSSTMPQKQNPVAAAALVALAGHGTALAGALRGAAAPRLQRDGAAWFTEWMALPQLVLCAAAAARGAARLAGKLRPLPEAMVARLEGTGLAHAESLSFALAAHMPRPDAQQAVKELAREAAATGIPLPALAARQWPELGEELRAATTGLGRAPAEARAFAAAMRERSAG